jgi:hypothetical protein
VGEWEVEKDFEWRLDEEKWPGGGRPPQRKPRRISRRWLAVALLLLALAGVAGLLAQWQWQRLTARATAAARADLLAAHVLAQQAVARRDNELLQAMLPDPNNRWATRLDRLIRAELYLDRAPLGLWLDRDAHTLEENLTEVRLSPNLERAEVVALLPYLVDSGNGQTEAVRLQQTFYYERSDADGRWLLAPAPVATSAQGWITDRQQWLSLIYPAEDEAIGRRLAIELDLLLQRLCRETIVDCPSGALIQLRLDREPESLLLLAENYRQVHFRTSPRRLDVRLPGPALVGLPVDEAGHAALYRGYAGWLAAVIVHDAAAQGTAAPVTGSLLATLDLQPPPAPGYHPLLGQRPPPVPFSDQAVQLLCSSFEGGAIRRYHPLDDTWQAEWTPANDHGLRFLRDEGSLEGLPGGRGVLLYGRQAVDGVPRWRAYLWRDGQAQLLLDEPEPYDPLGSRWLPAPVTADDRFVILAPRQPPGAVLDHWPYGPARAVDLSRCSTGGCPVWDFNGLPAVSPDGRLVAVNSAAGSWPELRLVRRESDQQRAPLSLGAGFSPFWWDNDRLGFVRPLFSRAQPMPEATELVVGHLVTVMGNAWHEEVWLKGSELIPALPEGYRTGEGPFLITAVTNYPGRPEWLLITAGRFTVEAAQHITFLFAFHPESGRIRYLMPVSPMDRVRISPNGRFLASADPSHIWIYAFDEGSRHMLDRYGATDLSWSEDERWLVLAEEGQIRLVLFGQKPEFQRVVPHDFRGCSSVAWIESVR